MPAKFLEPGDNLSQIGRVQAVVEARLRGHRGEADFKESEAAQMFVDPNDLDGTLGNRDARDDRARRVALAAGVPRGS